MTIFDICFTAFISIILLILLLRPIFLSKVVIIPFTNWVFLSFKEGEIFKIKYERINSDVWTLTLGRKLLISNYDELNRFAQDYLKEKEKNK